MGKKNKEKKKEVDFSIFDIEKYKLWRNKHNKNYIFLFGVFLLNFFFLFLFIFFAVLSNLKVNKKELPNFNKKTRNYELFRDYNIDKYLNKRIKRHFELFEFNSYINNKKKLSTVIFEGKEEYSKNKTLHLLIFKDEIAKIFVKNILNELYEIKFLNKNIIIVKNDYHKNFENLKKMDWFEYFQIIIKIIHKLINYFDFIKDCNNKKNEVLIYFFLNYNKFENINGNISPEELIKNCKDNCYKSIGQNQIIIKLPTKYLLKNMINKNYNLLKSILELNEKKEKYEKKIHLMLEDLDYCYNKLENFTNNIYSCIYFYNFTKFENLVKNKLLKKINSETIDYNKIISKIKFNEKQIVNQKIQNFLYKNLFINNNKNKNLSKNINFQNFDKLIMINFANMSNISLNGFYTNFSKKFFNNENILDWDIICPNIVSELSKLKHMYGSFNIKSFQSNKIKLFKNKTNKESITKNVINCGLRYIFRPKFGHKPYQIKSCSEEYLIFNLNNIFKKTKTTDKNYKKKLKMPLPSHSYHGFFNNFKNLKLFFNPSFILIFQTPIINLIKN